MHTPDSAHATSPASAPRPRRSLRRKILWSLLAGCAVVASSLGVFAYQHFCVRYQFSESMDVAIEEVTTAEYPEDPAARSPAYGQYNQRRLKLVQRDATHFDFILEPTSKQTARVVFRNVDVSLMTPTVPAWCLEDEGLIRIALTDREWNRQQVWFDRTGAHLEVTGGDGFESKRLSRAALAKNCLNAGLWEVILATEEDGQKSMYYQGWFTFPMGQYRRLFEQQSGLDYADHWYGLEHWSDPAGTVLGLDKLRTIYAHCEVPTKFNKGEHRIFAGEQLRKARTTNGANLTTWGDIVSTGAIEFASFIPPGRYSVEHPWSNEYWRLAQFQRTILRAVTCPETSKRLHELELQFHTPEGELQRFIVGGIDLTSLPQLSVNEYQRGLYMPMGIGVPPFYQNYAELQASPPHKSPYYSFLLDAKSRWIDHHAVAIDGPVMHLDLDDPQLVHLYFLSYERHTLVAHFEISLAQSGKAEMADRANGTDARK